MTHLLLVAQLLHLAQISEDEQTHFDLGVRNDHVSFLSMVFFSGYKGTSMVSAGRKREEYLPRKSIATVAPVIVPTRTVKRVKTAGWSAYTMSKYSYIEYKQCLS